MKVTYKSITFLLLLTVLGQFVYGQQIIKCDKTKSFWIFQKDHSFYAVKLLGKVNEQANKSVVAVNNYALQYVIVDKKNYIKAASINDDLELLTNYAMSEGEYMSGLFKQKLNLQLQKVTSPSGKTILIWFFEMPTSVSQEVKHQVFANIIIGDKIIGLSSSQFADQKLDDIKKFLMDVISTLKQLDNKDDFNKLCSQL